MSKSIGIVIAGLGTVGSGVFAILKKNSRLLERRVGGKITLRGILVKNSHKKRNIKIPASLLAKSFQEHLQDPDVQVFVELIGGTGLAKEWVVAALRAGKHVVTANKALLALHGKEIFSLAKKHQVDIFFEAAVAGGIPVLRAIREGLAANHIQSIYGILNGTCNYILTSMEQSNLSFHEALVQAQKLGYAEADPSFDVDGVDAAHKLAIVIALAYGVYVDFKKISYQGIRQISQLDIKLANQFGYKIKLLAMVREKNKNDPSLLHASVAPCLVATSSMMANVNDAFNAVMVEGDFVGKTLYYGRGAGAGPTASAVMGDVIEIARNIISGCQNISVPPLGHYDAHVASANIVGEPLTHAAYYLRFHLQDKPGVLAKITGMLGKHGVSIAAVHQQEVVLDKSIPVVILTHEISYAQVVLALKKIDKMAAVHAPSLLLPIVENI